MWRLADDKVLIQCDSVTRNTIMDPATALAVRESLYRVRKCVDDAITDSTNGAMTQTVLANTLHEVQSCANELHAIVHTTTSEK